MCLRLARRAVLIVLSVALILVFTHPPHAARPDAVTRPLSQPPNRTASDTMKRRTSDTVSMARFAAELDAYAAAASDAYAAQVAHAEADAYALAVDEQLRENERRERAVAPPTPARPALSPEAPGPARGDVWEALARCESGMTNADTGNGYYGYFQFLPGTWHALGYAGLPTDYDYPTQRTAAQALQARAGWGQWPACTAKLGLR
jgi:Transglycosylase-like domain